MKTAIGIKESGIGELVTYWRIAKMFAGAIPTMGDNGAHKQAKDRPLRPVTVTQEKALTKRQEKAIERQSIANDRVEDQEDQEVADYGERVEGMIDAIRRLSPENRAALKAAYIFSRKCLAVEREDLFQELMLKLLECKAPTEALAYTIARCDWRDWWKRYRTRKLWDGQSLNSVVDCDGGDGTEYGELLVGTVEYDRLVDGHIDGQALFDKLPDYIKRIVAKRLTGQGITGGDRIMLDKYVAKSGLLAC